MSAAYEKSKLLAANETGFEERRFRDQCPWTLEQALDLIIGRTKQFDPSRMI